MADKILKKQSKKNAANIEITQTAAHKWNRWYQYIRDQQTSFTTKVDFGASFQFGSVGFRLVYLSFFHNFFTWMIEDRQLFENNI